MSEVEKIIAQLKYDAKRLRKAQNISHAKALDQLALERGFRNWALLHKEYSNNENSIPDISKPKIP
jgi:hypothetical protein